MVKIANAKSHRVTHDAVKSSKGVASHLESILTAVNGVTPTAWKMLTKPHARGAKPPSTRTARARRCLRN